MEASQRAIAIAYRFDNNDCGQSSFALSSISWRTSRSECEAACCLPRASGQPQNVVETVGSRHDGPVGEELANSAYILVQDRAYGKMERFDRYKTEGQSFVIRLKENVQIVWQQSLRRQKTDDSPVTKDITCLLGTTQCRSQERHRVVMFQDGHGHGHEIRVVTDLRTIILAEQIAEIYKTRWQIGLFFRWIKQHLNVPLYLVRRKMRYMGSFILP
jgi:hypothetical protein